MQQTIKDGLCRTLVQAGIASLSRRMYSNRALILAYHNIVPDGEPVVGESILHLEKSEFARQLDLLSSTHEVRRLDDILTAEESDCPRVAITFDDAYSGALNAGLEVLEARSIPATYFVSPGLLNQTTYWWDAIAAAHSGVLPSNLRQTGLSALDGRQERILHWADREGIETGTVPEHSRSARMIDLQRAEALPGITIGSHTWHHPNLSRIGTPEVRWEIRRARRWLERNMESNIPWLAYPYGIPPVEPMSSTVCSDDYAVTVKPKLIDPRSPAFTRLAIPRINIPSGMSLSRFELLTSGL